MVLARLERLREYFAREAAPLLAQLGELEHASARPVLRLVEDDPEV